MYYCLCLSLTSNNSTIVHEKTVPKLSDVNQVEDVNYTSKPLNVFRKRTVINVDANVFTYLSI